jgi:hypothetical protein
VRLLVSVGIHVGLFYFPINVIYGFLNVGADTELNTLSTQQISSPLMERKETLGYGKLCILVCNRL